MIRWRRDGVPAEVVWTDGVAEGRVAMTETILLTTDSTALVPTVDSAMLPLISDPAAAAAEWNLDDCATWITAGVTFVA